MSSNVKVTMKKNWDKLIESGMSRGLAEIGVTIHKRAVQLAPKDTSALANSSRIDSRDGGKAVAITFGDDSVPYARIHELGGQAGRGRSVNIKAKHYLAEAGDSVARGETSKYFKNKWSL